MKDLAFPRRARQRLFPFPKVFKPVVGFVYFIPRHFIKSLNYSR